MTLRELLKKDYKYHHFTSKGIEAKQDDLTVIEIKYFNRNSHTVVCEGKRGGKISVSIEWAKTRGSYRVH